MEQTYPRFTPDMKKTHKILIPNMAPVQFRILAASMENHGYQVELLGNCGERVAELGLKYVHNDTCYPALLVIGQFLDALDSGKYDLDHTALIITQTGGGCRASNYIFLLRKALEKAGYGNIPVLSLNFSGLEKDSSMPMDLKFMRQALAAIYYGDLLMTLRAQTQPYELEAGAAERLQKQDPGLKIAGTHDGYFKEDAPVVEAIRESGADCVFVCLGAPKQELWMAKNGPATGAHLLCGLGGSLDVFAGTVARAPKFWSDHGLEWFYRLCKEPRRIGRMMKLPLFLVHVRQEKGKRK